MTKHPHSSAPQTKAAQKAHGHEFQLLFIVWGVLAWALLLMAIKYSVQ